MSAPAGTVALDEATPSSTPGAVTGGSEPAQHGSKAHSDGGWSLIPVQTRSERFTSADPGAFAAVTGFEPAWKYSPVAKLRPLIDGELDGSAIEHTLEKSDEITVEWIGRADARVASAGLPEEKASANAWSSFDQALAITVSGEEAQSLTLARSMLGGAPRAAHTVITAAKHSSATITFLNTGSARLSENVEIVLEDGAQLTVVSIQQWADDAIHLASHFARIGRDARLKHIIVSLDGAIIRLNTSVHLDSEGGDVELYGAYFVSAAQHIEQQVFVDHVAANTKSRVTYKGALQGRDARSVWVGDVLIRQTAAGTDSYEQNRNLLLTEGARADSIPNLEIETGDIAGAGHASASGRFDDEQLFYLQARGISEQEARRLVVRGFLAEIVQKIGATELESRLAEAIEGALVHEGALK
ncbi:MAG: Fe-S cluster assembly protein SufD [Microbacteriaceae bacterium]|nr:Fe-S cluster assembly protein SufD [Microbacteriaceae bacterium]